MEKKQFTVYGRVQGVGFRYFTQREARKIGVVGSVRNLSDGSVLVVAGGTAQQIAQLSKWLQKGPPTAHVERMLEQAYLPEIDTDEFKIEHSF